MLIAIAVVALLVLIAWGILRCDHEDTLVIGDRRLWLRCGQCGRETPGLDLTTR